MIQRHKLCGVVVLAGFLIAANAFAGDDSSRRRVRLGGVMVGANYSTGPAWYGPWGMGPGFYRPWWGLYDPFWSSGFLHPGLYRGFGHGPDMGQIKLKAAKDSFVYLDGAFAGSAEKLKSIWLEPGVYELQVSNPDGFEFKKKVYVLSGKTLDLRAERSTRVKR
jgi:hypothetical protein